MALLGDQTMKEGGVQMLVPPFLVWESCLIVSLISKMRILTPTLQEFNMKNIAQSKQIDIIIIMTIIIPCDLRFLRTHPSGTDWTWPDKYDSY